MVFSHAWFTMTVKLFTLDHRSLHITFGSALQTFTMFGVSDTNTCCVRSQVVSNCCTNAFL